MVNRYKPYLYALVASLLWASSPTVIKLLLGGLNSVQILFVASGIATLFLFSLVVIQGKLQIIRDFQLKDYATFAAMGFLGVFVYYLCLYLAISFLSAQEAFIINYLWPILTVFFAAVILREKLSPKTVLALFVSFVGVVIIGTKGVIMGLQFTSMRGVLLAVGGAVAYALFSTLGKRLKYDRTVSMMFYYLATFIYTALAVKYFGGAPHLIGLQTLGLLWIGAFTSGFAFLLWFLALKDGATPKVSNMVYLTPFLSLIYIFFILHEPIRLSSVIGLLVIISGILIQNWQSTKPEA